MGQGQVTNKAHQTDLSFAHRLHAAVERSGTPLCVGLDPRLASLPKSLQPADPTSLAQIAEAFRLFSREVIDVVAGQVGVVKPQAAFFEQYGAPGFAALADVVAYARQRGLLVVLDGKRNDIGSTAEAYADAYLAGPQAPVASDALTVSPYLGADSLEPFVAVAQQHGTGIFVLVKTSNPGSGLFQDLVADGQPLYRHVAAQVESLASGTMREGEGYGAVGAVVGATYPEQLTELRAAMPHAWLLVPGLGAQGATAAEVRAAYDARGYGAIINSSRAIIFAHARREYAAVANWQDAVAAATRETVQELAAHRG